MKNITTGCIVIAYGFFSGGSVFLGHPGPLDWVFDGLGVGLILLGLWKVYTKRS
ncbi:MAG: hypothetical protein U0931_21055 [Vulcanimicrobiota bacterium]